VLSAEAALSFRNEPVVTEVVSTDATPLRSLLSDGMVMIDRLRHARTIELLPDGRARLQLRGEIGKAYQIEVSSDLMHWRQIKIVALTDSVAVVDVGAQFSLAGFYRVRPVE
jgi:hypothetical protein